MIDRTELDTRIAIHTRRVARVDADTWRLAPAPRGARLRPRLAAALVGRAARIGPPPPTSVVERPAGA
jgi:hypothetical protein